MADYRELNVRKPEAFLKPEDFRTPFDTAARAEEQYQKGLLISEKAYAEGGYVYISGSSTWGAQGDGHTASYEGIGYHSCTSDLLRGFLAGPARIIVHRLWLSEPVEIKKARS